LSCSAPTRQVGHLLGLSPPGDGVQGEGVGSCRFHLVEDRPGHRRVDEARVDRVDTDASIAVLQSGVLGHAPHYELRGCVGERAPGAGQPVGRGDVDDGPSPVRQHGWNGPILKTRENPDASPAGDVFNLPATRSPQPAPRAGPAALSGELIGAGWATGATGEGVMGTGKDLGSKQG
jgi:hypothetical protein